MAAGSHTGSDFLIHQDSADRQAAAQALGQRDDVGLKVVVLAAQEGAGAAHAGLHLIHDEDEVLFVAEGADRLHILGVQCHNTALALYQF